MAAAERAVTVSRFVADLLALRMREDRAYASALRSNLARPPVPLSAGGGYPARDALHDRPPLPRR